MKTPLHRQLWIYTCRCLSHSPPCRWPHQPCSDLRHAGGQVRLTLFSNLEDLPLAGPSQPPGGKTWWPHLRNPHPLGILLTGALQWLITGRSPSPGLSCTLWPSAWELVLALASSRRCGPQPPFPNCKLPYHCNGNMLVLKVHACVLEGACFCNKTQSPQGLSRCTPAG